MNVDTLTLVCHLNHLDYYRYDIWISTPPLLIEDTSLTVYFCSGYYFFDYGEIYRSGTMRAAIREAASSTWNYTDSFLSCYRRECQELYHQNYSNYLVASQMFNSLKPNTLYSLEFLGCFEYYYGTCIVGNTHLRHRINITTRPEGG